MSVYQKKERTYFFLKFKGECSKKLNKNKESTQTVYSDTKIHFDQDLLWIRKSSTIKVSIILVYWGHRKGVFVSIRTEKDGWIRLRVGIQRGLPTTTRARKTLQSVLTPRRWMPIFVSVGGTGTPVVGSLQPDSVSRLDSCVLKFFPEDVTTDFTISDEYISGVRRVFLQKSLTK